MFDAEEAATVFEPFALDEPETVFDPFALDEPDTVFDPFALEEPETVLLPELCAPETVFDPFAVDDPETVLRLLELDEPETVFLLELVEHDTVLRCAARQAAFMVFAFAWTTFACTVVRAAQRTWFRWALVGAFDPSATPATARHPAAIDAPATKSRFMASLLARW